MIHPFRPEDVKPASYAFRLKGLCRDEKGSFVEIEEGDDFELKPNSIAFVTLEPYIRLPDYIALRFNLKIKNVYRGLLLGTGPLIDPGFEGRLSIPLHNLTANSYRFRGGETMIWVEFTKLSPNDRWMQHSNDQAPRDAELYVPFPADKYGRQLTEYLHDADPLRVIVSSIPGVFTEAREAAEKANAAATRTQIITGLTILGILAIVFAAFSLTRGFVSDARNDLRTHVEVTDSLLHRVADLQRKVDSLTRAGPRGVGRK
jgi:deoxycytidine triphosphate deaminase